MDLLSSLSRVSRRLPPTRTKVRAGRALTAVAAALGADPVRVTRLSDGSLLELDLRSRTEAGPFWEGTYEADNVALLADLAQVYGGVVYDVGANVGLVAVPLARRLPANGRVVAFEPVAVNCARLVRNASRNGLDAQLCVHRTALGESNGTVRIAMESGHGATTGNAVLTAVDRPENNSDVTVVPMRRLDDLVDEEDEPLPDVVKVDVEGAEVAWLRGAQRTLAAARPVILGEFNSGLMPRFGNTFLDVPALLPVDYEIFSFVAAGRVRRREPAVGLGDVLLVPTEKLARLPLEVVR